MDKEFRRPQTAGPGSSISSLSSQLAAQAPPTRPASAQGIKTTTSQPDEDVDKADALRRPAKSLNTLASSTIDLPPPPSLLAPFTPRRMSFPNRLSLQMPSRGPLSPVLDPALGYSVARRPRLDFARACTSLHHSTLAESSPDSSPLASNGGYPIPRNNGNRPLDSPISNHYNHGAASSHASSLGSTSMLDYAPSGDDSDSTSDEDIGLDIDALTPLTAVPTPTESAASLSLRNHQKARRPSRRWRRPGHPSGSGGASFLNPSPTLRAHAPSLDAAFEMPMRRDSLDLGPSALELARPEPVRPDPIRRPVSRRGSLLPKTKNFQRIKAALIEESSPVDVEVKREAEITRQIREEDHNPSPPAPSEGRAAESELSDINEEEGTESSGDSQVGNRGIGISFSKQAQKHGGFWFSDQMDGIGGNPPIFPTPKMSSDGDVIMGSDSALNSPVSNVSADVRRNKRRRAQEDFFEPSVFKRRAVSPGLAHSPILAQSPPGNGGRRINYQGMTDTHDGLMKMSLQ